MEANDGRLGLRTIEVLCLLLGIHVACSGFQLVQVQLFGNSEGLLLELIIDFIRFIANGDVA